MPDHHHHLLMAPASDKREAFSSGAGADALGFPALVVELTKAEDLGSVSYSDLKYTASLKDTLREGSSNTMKMYLRKKSAAGRGRDGHHRKKKARKPGDIRGNKNLDVGRFGRDNVDDDESTVNLSSFLTRPALVQEFIDTHSLSPDARTAASDFTSALTGNSFEDAAAVVEEEDSNLEAHSAGAYRHSPQPSTTTAAASAPAFSNNSGGPNLSLPIIRAVSPRTHRQIGRLPKPNEKETRRMKEIEDNFREDSKLGRFSVYTKVRHGTAPRFTREIFPVAALASLRNCMYIEPRKHAKQHPDVACSLPHASRRAAPPTHTMPQTMPPGQEKKSFYSVREA